ncbi:MAG: hypothetical protein BAJATHORv1_60162 [Candidatus Thorarchaeota archaeon]|nr:MAG: hypothetical protein BAJATHORv1_60162 [Candidatus Thorarchaeota archaeon]
MIKSIALHSYKGGTGRTTLSANIAAILAQRGYDVVLLDMDTWAPSLHTIFRVESPKYFVGQYLSEELDYQELLIDMSSALGLKGKLHLGVANQDIDIIQEYTSKDREWHKKALSRILHLRDALQKDGFDILIFDLASGAQPSTVNAIVSSDHVLNICKVDNFDLNGTVQLNEKLYRPLDKTVSYLLNKIPRPLLNSMETTIVNTVKNSFGSDADILGYFVYSPEVAMTMGVEVHAISKPEIDFVSDLKIIANKLLLNLGKNEGGN